MRDPELALRTAYTTCLDGKIICDGRTVPVFVSAVPMGVEPPYIAIAELNYTPDLSLTGFTAYTSTVLLDIVTRFDNQNYEFSKASLIGQYVLELTQKVNLNTAIKQPLSAETSVQLAEIPARPDNSTVVWEITRHLLESSITMLEQTETALYNRRLIRLRDDVFLKS